MNVLIPKWKNIACSRRWNANCLPEGKGVTGNGGVTVHVTVSKKLLCSTNTSRCSRPSCHRWSFFLSTPLLIFFSSSSSACAPPLLLWKQQERSHILSACLPACTFVLIFFTLPPFLFFYYSHSDISFHSRESWGFSRRPDAVKREQSTCLHCLKRQKTFTQSASTTLRAATIMKKERKNGNGWSSSSTNARNRTFLAVFFIVLLALLCLHRSFRNSAIPIVKMRLVVFCGHRHHDYIFTIAPLFVSILSSSLIPIIPPSTPSHLLLLSFLVDQKETQHKKQSHRNTPKTVSHNAHSQKSHKNTPKPLMNRNIHKNTKNTHIH